jgi:hypothetical protein
MVEERYEMNSEMKLSDEANMARFLWVWGFELGTGTGFVVQWTGAAISSTS